MGRTTTNTMRFVSRSSKRDGDLLLIKNRICPKCKERGIKVKLMDVYIHGTKNLARTEQSVGRSIIFRPVLMCKFRHFFRDENVKLKGLR